MQFSFQTIHCLFILGPRLGTLGSTKMNQTQANLSGWGEGLHTHTVLSIWVISGKDCGPGTT